jgi:hypothetical protein
MKCVFLVLATAVLLGAQEGKKQRKSDFEKRVDAAIDRGVESLLRKNTESPACPQLDAALNSDELILLTLIHAGVGEADPRFQQLFKGMMSRLERVYNVALQAMVLEQLDPVKYQRRIYECAQYLVDQQCANGQWGYGQAMAIPAGEPEKVKAKKGWLKRDPSDKRPVPQVRVKVKKTRESAGPLPNNSTSQYAALGMRASYDAGMILPEETIRKAAQWWNQCRLDKGKEREAATATGAAAGPGIGWGYWLTPEDGQIPLGAMTAGAAGSLVIYDYMLGMDWKKDNLVRGGMNWLTNNFTVTEHVGMVTLGYEKTNSLYYYLYSLERVGVLYGTEFLGRHAWYPEGAKFLLDAQRADGSWEDWWTGGGSPFGTPVSQSSFSSAPRGRWSMLPALTRNEVGFPVTFRVGGEDSPFGEDLRRVEGPRYVEGYLPIIQTSYRCDGVTVAQEVFAAVEPPLAQHGGVFVRFILNEGEGVPVTATVGYEGSIREEDGKLCGEKGETLVTFDKNWTWDHSLKRLLASVSPPTPASLCVFTVPSSDAGPLTPAVYEEQRKKAADEWQALLGRGVRLEVPETVVGHNGISSLENGLDDPYGLRYVMNLLKRDEVERALVSFYGKLAHGLTRDTFIGGEVTGLVPQDDGGRSMYLPPNSFSNAFFLCILRYLLVQDWDMNEDGEPETLRLLFGTPRRWLEDGAAIRLERAPTAFGDVSVSVRSRLSQGEVLAEIQPPERSPQRTVLRLRLPPGWRAVSAEAEGKPLDLDAQGTADISSLRGKCTLRFQVTR